MREMGGMTGLLLLLWVGVTVCSDVDLHKRIVGGQECQDTEAQYYVKINDPGGKLVCGGTLITDQWILTAAHCWHWAMTVVIGIHPTKVQTKTEVQIVAAPVMYEDKDKVHDIMLLKLPTATQFKPVQLPDCKKNKKPIKNDHVQIAGYGATSAEAESEVKESEALQCVKVTVVPCASSKNSDSHQQMFCGKTEGVKICSGDSGGGVVYDDKIFGVVSYLHENPCTESVGIMDACKYMSWIKKKTAKGIWDKLKAG